MKKYLSLVKFSHTIFAMPFALIGFAIAVLLHGYSFDAKILLLMIACMIFARNAAMAFNRYIDAEIDRKNERTITREIPKGDISKRSALIFVIANCIAFIVATFFINPLCFYLSPVAILVILGYSYTKRFTALCHLVLGLGLSLAPIGAYLSLSGQFHWLPILFSFAVLFWVSGFDIIYALQDEAFDRSNKLHSIPVYLGKSKALKLSTIFHLLTTIFLLFAGLKANFGVLYWVAFLIFTGLLAYQHTIVKPYDLSKVNLAFFTTNGIASVLFGVLVITDLLFKP